MTASVATKHDQWYALAIDFRIAGVGPTHEAAIRDLTHGLYAYLRTCFEEGLSYHEARRPVPFWRRTWVRSGSLARRILRGLAPPPLPHSDRFRLPSALRDAPRAT